MDKQYEIVHYEENGKDIFNDYVSSLRDRIGRTVIERTVRRIEAGNFGEHKSCRSGVWELKIDYGAGYRVYYSIVGNKVVLLLCAGTKRTQQKDIDKAVEYLQRFTKKGLIS